MHPWLAKEPEDSGGLSGDLGMRSGYHLEEGKRNGRGKEE